MNRHWGHEYVMTVQNGWRTMVHVATRHNTFNTVTHARSTHQLKHAHLISSLQYGSHDISALIGLRIYQYTIIDV